MTGCRPFPSIAQGRIDHPFVFKLRVLIPDDNPAIDARLILAGGILLAAVEGKQN